MYDLIAKPGVATDVTTLCRLSTERARWRVKVQAWDGSEGWRGRLVFETDGTKGVEVREGPAALRGHTREELLVVAHEIPERRLRELLHSLG